MVVIHYLARELEIELSWQNTSPARLEHFEEWCWGYKYFIMGWVCPKSWWCPSCARNGTTWFLGADWANKCCDFPQQGKVHQFRIKTRMRSWLLDKPMTALTSLMRVCSLLTLSILELFPNFKAQPSLGAHRGDFSCTDFISQACFVVKEAKLVSPECKMGLSQRAAHWSGLRYRQGLVTEIPLRWACCLVLCRTALGMLVVCDGNKDNAAFSLCANTALQG